MSLGLSVHSQNGILQKFEKVSRKHKMIGVLGHDFALVRPGTTWANEINFVMKHAPSARSLIGPVDQHSPAPRIPTPPVYQHVTRYIFHSIE